MASILELDPREAGRGAAASVLGRMSAPSRLPVGIGSILGAAAGAYDEAHQKASFQQEQLAGQKQLREAQAAQLREQAEARRAALVEQQTQAQKKANFSSILGKMVQNGEQPDEISILGAGIESGAFGPREITEFMSKVTEKRAARESALERERLRLEDKAAAREEREAAERRTIELRAELAKDRDRLLATLRPQPQEPLVPVEQPDGTVVYTPRSQAAGKPVPPPRRDARGLPPNAIKDLGEKGELATNFIRLTGTFDDKYGGKKAGVIGDVQNTIGRNIGAGYGDQADWWQDYQMEKNKVRNKLFGSALTSTEASEFDKAVINPGMKPEIIRKNLARQKAMAVRAAKKLAGAYQKGGYNEAQIFEALGISPDELAGAEEKDPWE